METWQTILLAIGGNTALIAVLGFLGKSLLEKIIARDTKKFESDLKAKSDATIERLKNELKIKTIEHQVRYTRLHEKRAEVIAELYAHLVEGLWEAESFLSPMEWNGEPKKEEKYVTAMNKLSEVYRYFDQHRIYLPSDLCDKLHDFISNVRSHCIKFGVYLPHEESRQKDEAWNKGWESIKNETPKARTALEKEFRKILGNPDASNS